MRYLLALLWAHPILHISTIRVKAAYLQASFVSKQLYTVYYTMRQILFSQVLRPALPKRQISTKRIRRNIVYLRDA